MEVYETLRSILDTHPSGAPESAVFDKILRLLFSPQEASLAIHMNFSPKPLAAIATASDITTEEARQMLEAMAGRGVVFSREKDGNFSYGLLPTIPGLFEYPFLKGKDTPVLEELGELWQEYHREGLGASFAGSQTPLTRIIPVGESLAPQDRIHPYEEVAKLIGMVDFIALARCACRVSVGACNAPQEVCFFFDAPARFLVEKGFAREINRDEAIRVLDQAEEAGLVHTSSNSMDRPAFICNCCKCCCTILRGMTQLRLPHAFAVSAYISSVHKDECTGCGICADERCPVGAIKMTDDVADIDSGMCIGCGLCVTACPVNALVLDRRDNPPVPSATIQDMAVKVLSEKGKLEKFMQVMKK
jgi:Na+-translocating ferredoxin:NAD+ oxidoreductase subunit B